MLCLLFALIGKQATIYFYFKMKISFSRIYFSSSVLNLFYGKYIKWYFLKTNY